MSEVSVVGLQAAGFFSTSTYISLDEDLPNDLVNFTMCVWINMAFLRGGWSSYFLSYAVEGSDNELMGAFRFRSNKTPNTLIEGWTLYVEMCKNKYRTGDCARKYLSRPPFRRWIHVCGSFWCEEESRENVSSTQTRKAVLYVDGEHGSISESKVFDERFVALGESPGSLIIGQEQDLMGGAFSEEQAFSGWVTEFNMWRGLLNEDRIIDMANCRSTFQGDIVSWRNSKWNLFNVDQIRQPLSTLCSVSPNANKFMMLQDISFNSIKPICDVVGGELPTPSSPEETNNQQLEIIEATKGFIPHDLCHDPQRPFSMIVGIKYDELAKDWINIYTGQAATLTPNPVARTAFEADCAFSILSGLDISDCSSDFGCGICYLKSHTWFHVKGFCTADINKVKWYDFLYYIHGFQNGKPHFLGISNSHIYYDNSTSRWKLQSLRDDSKFLSLHISTPTALPFGRQKWMVGSDLSVCAKDRKELHTLTFSRCLLHSEFTCDDGHCIPISERCDTKINCDDQSDESGCDYLKVSPNYAKQLAPPHSSHEDVDLHERTTVVSLNVSIQALPKIDTVHFSFTADFFLTLRWHDKRLQFRNLNAISKLNALNMADLETIWTPKLIFMNALGSFHSTVDDMASTWIDRKGAPTTESYEYPTEAQLYNGNENPISVSRKYFYEFSCNFDLRHYPFDTQMCFLEISAPWSEGFALEKHGPGVDVFSNISLLEYEILRSSMTIEAAGGNEAVKAIVKIVIRRRVEYHLTSTFLQTFILVGVGFMSLYFKENNFTDRIMVSITNLVVVATITSSVQQNLPKTHYFKLIDWWLMFCINILVLLMAFHTYLAALQHKHDIQMIMHQEKKKKVTCISLRKEFKSLETYDSLANFKKLYQTNQMGKICIASIIVLFNVIFWSVAISHCVDPAE